MVGEVLCSTSSEHPGVTGAEMTRRTGVSQPTVSRELGRLADAGWIRLRPLGTVKIAEPITTLPIYIPVRQLVASTIGVLQLLRGTLEDDDRIVEAWIFGSWAARFHGEPGPFPNDIDLAVVGTISLPEAYRNDRGHPGRNKHDHQYPHLPARGRHRVSHRDQRYRCRREEPM